MNLLPIRLSPGQDLRRALETAIHTQSADAAFVLSGIGSLVDAHIRFADQASETSIPGPLELVSISGSLTTTGAHLHVTVSDGVGKVTGGHLGYGNIIRTTAELLLVMLPDWALSREHDAHTGFPELVIRMR